MNTPPNSSSFQSESFMNKTFIDSKNSSENQSFSFNGEILNEVGPVLTFQKVQKASNANLNKVDDERVPKFSKQIGACSDLILDNLSFSTISGKEASGNEFSKSFHSQLPLIDLNQKLHHSTTTFKFGFQKRNKSENTLDFADFNGKGSTNSLFKIRNQNQNYPQLQKKIVNSPNFGGAKKCLFQKSSKQIPELQQKNVWNIPENLPNEEYIWWEQTVANQF